MHEYVPSVLATQMPLFWHGLDPHGAAVAQFVPPKLDGHEQ